MKSTIALALSGFMLTGCTATLQPLQHRGVLYTYGDTQVTFEKGVTTKSNVLEAFGAPYIAIADKSGKGVFTYQKHEPVSQGSSISRTITMIIKFDKNEKFHGLKTMTSSF